MTFLSSTWWVQTVSGLSVGGDKCTRKGGALNGFSVLLLKVRKIMCFDIVYILNIFHRLFGHYSNFSHLF